MSEQALYYPNGKIKQLTGGSVPESRPMFDDLFTYHFTKLILGADQPNKTKYINVPNK